MTSSPTFYILTGLSFAGKSVLAREIALVMEATIVDPDAVAHERGLGQFGEAVTDEQWLLVHAEAERRAGELLQVGRSVVYDTTGFNREQRDRLRSLGHEKASNSVVIYVRIAPDEAERRWSRNNQTRERFLVQPADVRRVLSAYQPPQTDEPHLIYDSGEPINEWLDLHLV